MNEYVVVACNNLIDKAFDALQEAALDKMGGICEQLPANLQETCLTKASERVQTADEKQEMYKTSCIGMVQNITNGTFNVQGIASAVQKFSQEDGPSIADQFRNHFDNLVSQFEKEEEAVKNGRLYVVQQVSADQAMPSMRTSQFYMMSLGAVALMVVSAFVSLFLWRRSSTTTVNYTTADESDIPEDGGLE